MKEAEKKDSKANILIVEDHEDTVQLLTMLLSALGYNTMVAYDGIEALGKIEANPPDLIISDIVMPRMNGLKFCQTLRQKENMRLIPFIFLSSRTAVEDKIKGIEIGADDYLEKPFSSHELITRVKRSLERKKLYEEALKFSSDSLNGNLKDISILELLQFLEMNTKTGVLNLRQDNKRCKIFFEAGQITTCVSNFKKGKAIIEEVLEWKSGFFNFKRGIIAKRKDLLGSSTQILLEKLTLPTRSAKKIENLPINEEEVEKIPSSKVEGQGMMIDLQELLAEEIGESKDVRSSYPKVQKELDLFRSKNRGVRGIVVCVSRGNLIASSTEPNIDPKLFGELTVPIFTASEKATNQLLLGKADELVFEYAEAKMVIVKTGRISFIAAIIEKETNLANIIFSLKKLSEQISQMI